MSGPFSLDVKCSATWRDNAVFAGGGTTDGSSGYLGYSKGGAIQQDIKVTISSNKGYELGTAVCGSGALYSGFGGNFQSCRPDPKRNGKILNIAA